MADRFTLSGTRRDRNRLTSRSDMARLRGRASPGPPQHELLLQREEGPIAAPPLTIFAGWRGGSAVESRKGRRRHG